MDELIGILKKQAVEKAKQLGLSDEDIKLLKSMVDK